MKTERIMTAQEIAEWKIDILSEEINKLKTCPDLLHTPDGSSSLSFIKDISTDLTEWLESKRQAPKLYAIPEGKA